MLRLTRSFRAAAVAALLGLGCAAPARAGLIPFTVTGAGGAELLTPPPVSAFLVTGDYSFDPLGDATLSLLGEIDFTVVLPDGSTPAAGTFTFTFSGGDTLFGTSTQLNSPPGPGGETPFTVEYAFEGGTGRFAGATGSMSTQGQFVFLTETTAAFADSGAGTLNVVPEPSACALLALGAGGLLAYGWRRPRRPA